MLVARLRTHSIMGTVSELNSDYRPSAAEHRHPMARRIRLGAMIATGIAIGFLFMDHCLCLGERDRRPGVAMSKPGADASNLAGSRAVSMAYRDGVPPSAIGFGVCLTPALVPNSSTGSKTQGVHDITPASWYAADGEAEDFTNQLSPLMVNPLRLPQIVPQPADAGELGPPTPERTATRPLVADSQPPAVPPPAGPEQVVPARPGVRRTPEELPPPSPVYDLDARPLRSLTIDTRYPEGDLPVDLGREKLARMEAGTSDALPARDWPLACYRWQAPALGYHPLYFEQVNLERFGCSPRHLAWAQPAISAAHFFSTVPLLPYKMVAQPVRECVYPLGHYRPGCEVPCDLILPPWSWRGLATESAVAAGLILLIP